MKINKPLFVRFKEKEFVYASRKVEKLGTLKVRLFSNARQRSPQSHESSYLTTFR